MADLYEGTKYENLDPKYREKIIHKGMKETAKKDYGKPKSAKSQALKNKKEKVAGKIKKPKLPPLQKSEDYDEHESPFKKSYYK